MNPNDDPILQGCSQSLSGNQPGQISYSELIKEGIYSDEQKRFELDGNYNQMEEMDFDLPRKQRYQSSSSPESGQMSKQPAQQEAIEEKYQNQQRQTLIIEKDQKTPNPQITPNQKLNHESWKLPRQEIINPIIQEKNQSSNESNQVQFQMAVPQQNLNMVEQTTQFIGNIEENPIYTPEIPEKVTPELISTIIPFPIQADEFSGQLKRSISQQKISLQYDQNIENLPQQLFSKLGNLQMASQVEISQPLDEQINFQSRKFSYEAPQFSQSLHPVILQPPVKIVKNSYDEYHQIKLLGDETYRKMQDEFGIKEQINSNNATFGTIQKLQQMTDEIKYDDLKQVKWDFKLYTKPQYMTGTKNILQKKQSFEQQSSSQLTSCKIFSQSKIYNSQLLKQFKNQPYQIRNRYFEHESNIYKKYILNMQSTLQKEYEKCRLRDHDKFNNNRYEWEIIDLNQKDFCIMVKKDQSENQKLNQQTLKEHQNYHQQFKQQNKVPNQNQQKFTQHQCSQNSIQSNKSKQQDYEKTIFQYTPQLLTQFSILKEQRIENNSTKFRNYLKYVMVHMSNFIDMTDKIYMVLKMNYKQLINFYSNVVGPRNILKYENFNFTQEEQERNEDEQLIERDRMDEQQNKNNQNQISNTLKLVPMQLQQMNNQVNEVNVNQKQLVHQQFYNKNTQKNTHYINELQPNVYIYANPQFKNQQQLSKIQYSIISMETHHNVIEIVQEMNESIDQQCTPVFGQDTIQQQQQQPIVCQNNQEQVQQHKNISYSHQQSLINNSSVMSNMLSNSSQQSQLPYFNNDTAQVNQSIDKMTAQELRQFIKNTLSKKKSEQHILPPPPLIQSQPSVVSIQQPNPTQNKLKEDVNITQIQNQNNSVQQIKNVELQMIDLQIQSKQPVIQQNSLHAQSHNEIHQPNLIQKHIQSSDNSKINQQPFIDHNQTSVQTQGNINQFVTQQQKNLDDKVQIQPMTFIAPIIYNSQSIAQPYIKNDLLNVVNQHQNTEPVVKPTHPKQIIDISEDSQQSINVPLLPQKPQQQSQKIAIVSEVQKHIEQIPQVQSQPIVEKNPIQRPSVEEIRNILIDTYPTAAPMISVAAQTQILALYYQVTESLAIQNNDSNNKANTIIQQKQLINQIPESIIEQQPSPYQPQNPIPIPILTQNSNAEPKQDLTYEELDAILQTLIETNPDMKDQIANLSKDDLLELYREGFKDKQKEDQKLKSKKTKKNNQAQIIDLQDQPSQKLPIQNSPIDGKTISELPILKNSEVRSQKSASNHQSQMFSYAEMYKIQKKQKQKILTNSPNTPIYVNKTLLYQLLSAHDYTKKIESILKPKESIKYQQQTQKQVALMYLQHIKSKNYSKGPFEVYGKQNGKKPGPNDKGFMIIGTKKSIDLIKNEELKKVVCKDKFLTIDMPLINEQRKSKILELRNKRIATERQNSNSLINRPQQKSSDQVQQLNSSEVPLLSVPISNLVQPKEVQSIRRRYCLIIEDQLDPRQSQRLQQQISLQSSNMKRVKKTCIQTDEKQIVKLLRGFSDRVETDIELE